MAIPTAKRSPEIPISHESLFVPHAKSFECPNIADIFPQVWQMALDGKYAEAAEAPRRHFRRGGNASGGGLASHRAVTVTAAPV